MYRESLRWEAHGCSSGKIREESPQGSWGVLIYNSYSTPLIMNYSCPTIDSRLNALLDLSRLFRVWRLLCGCCRTCPWVESKYVAIRCILIYFSFVFFFFGILLRWPMMIELLDRKQKEKKIIIVWHDANKVQYWYGCEIGVEKDDSTESGTESYKMTIKVRSVKEKPRQISEGPQGRSLCLI